jgi:hypothetical protein
LKKDYETGEEIVIVLVSAQFKIIFMMWMDDSSSVLES